MFSVAQVNIFRARARTDYKAYRRPSPALLGPGVAPHTTAECIHTRSLLPRRAGLPARTPVPYTQGRPSLPSEGTSQRPKPQKRPNLLTGADGPAAMAVGSPPPTVTSARMYHSRRSNGHMKMLSGKGMPKPQLHWQRKPMAAMV